MLCCKSCLHKGGFRHAFSYPACPNETHILPPLTGTFEFILDKETHLWRRFSPYRSLFFNLILYCNFQEVSPSTLANIQTFSTQSDRKLKAIPVQVLYCAAMFEHFLALEKLFTLGNYSSLQKLISGSFELHGRWISPFRALFTNSFVLTLFQQNKCFFIEIFVVESKATEPLSRIITTTD